MKEININKWLIVNELYSDIPKDFTGRVNYNNVIIYFENGRIHNETGPAVLAMFGNGLSKSYWLHGIEFYKHKWFDALSVEQKIRILLNPESFDMIYDK